MLYDSVDSALLEGNYTPDDVARKLRSVRPREQLWNFTPLLPGMLRIEDKPMTLERHFHFEPAFRVSLAKKCVFMCARQVGKSMTEAAQAIIQALCIPFFHTLVITPLYEQVRKLSSNYFRPMIETSPVRGLIAPQKQNNNVLQRNVGSSIIHFGFTGINPDRLRGIPVKKLVVDEMQDIHSEHLPIVQECLSAARDWGIIQLAGTPKTPQNTANLMYRSSSMAEWCIRCGCGRWNIASSSYDLDRMIGPLRDDIGPDRPGLICASSKCGKPLRSETGMWIHRKPQLIDVFPGYHLPQPVTYSHYSSRTKWAELLGKRDGLGGYDQVRYANEVLGEAAGEGAQLISEDDLRQASDLGWDNDERDYHRAVPHRTGYIHRVLAVDWGGGGDKGTSLTTLAVLGYLSNGKIHVLWGARLHTPHNPLLEASQCLDVAKAFNCKEIVHDFSGAGAMREHFFVGSGVPKSAIIPVRYVGATKGPLMKSIPPHKMYPRTVYSLDKPRSLQFICEAIKLKLVRFFNFDWKTSENPGLISDFLALMEEKLQSRFGTDVFTIVRDMSKKDDFAQAVNIGCAYLWWRHRSLPELASVWAKQMATEEDYGPATPDWDENESFDLGDQDD